MPEFDQGFKMIAETTGRQIARLAGVECRELAPLESTLQVTTERLADRVFLGRQRRERFAVYFEFYTTWDRNAPWDMLAKSGLISEREHLPTVCIAVVLRRQGFRSTGGGLRLEAAGGPTQQLWLKELCLWTLKPEAWWEGEPGLMALYPLCDHGRRPRDAIAHAAAAIEAKVPGVVERDDRLALLSIFGELAFPSLDVERIIGSEKMKESRMLRRIRTEGELRAGRAAILRVLRTRFRTEPPADLASALDAVDDVGRLETLLDLAVTCSDVASFQAAMQLQGTTS
jgi:hypothetical protein